MQLVCAQGRMDLESSVLPSPLEAGTGQSPSRFPLGVSQTLARVPGASILIDRAVPVFFFFNFGFVGSSSPCMGFYQ